MSGLLDDLLNNISDPQKPNPKKNEIKGSFTYSKEFSEYAQQEDSVVDGENKASENGL